MYPKKPLPTLAIAAAHASGLTPARAPDSDWILDELRRVWIAELVT